MAFKQDLVLVRCLQQGFYWQPCLFWFLVPDVLAENCDPRVVLFPNPPIDFNIILRSKIQDMASGAQEQKPKREPENKGLDLSLAVTLAFFMNRNTIPERSFNTVFALNKKMIATTRSLSAVR